MNKLCKLLVFSLVSFFIISIKVSAIGFDKEVSEFEIYGIKEKREVLVTNVEIIDFFEENYDKLNDLIERKRKKEEEIARKQRIANEKKLNLQKRIANFAVQFVGNPYVLGGTSLTDGADCSGFVQSVFRNFSIKVSRVTTTQAKDGVSVSYDDIQIADIVSYGYNNISSHSAIYIGNGKVVHASTPELGIRIDNINMMPIVDIRRVI